MTREQKIDAAVRSVVSPDQMENMRVAGRHYYFDEPVFYTFDEANAVVESWFTEEVSAIRAAFAKL